MTLRIYAAFGVSQTPNIRKARKEQFMPRPVKCRKVCHFPNVLEFLPADNAEKKVPIVLTVDEYETIRLLDKKGYSQEQCAVSMQIARTTVQRIYEIARKKIADALIDGHPLRIEGGDFRICDGQSSNCSFGGCYKQEIYKKSQKPVKNPFLRTKKTIFLKKVKSPQSLVFSQCH